MSELYSSNNTGLTPTCFRRLLKRSITVPIVGALITFGLLLWQIQSLFLSTNWLDHTDKVIGEGFELQSLMLEVQADLRIILFWNNFDYFDSYQRNLKRVPEQLDLIRSLIKDNTTQLDQLQKVGSQWKVWDDWQQRLLSKKLRGERTSTKANADEGFKYMFLIRSEMTQFLHEEAQLRKHRVTEMNSAHRLTLQVLFGLLIFLSGLTYFSSRRSFYSLSKSYEALIVQLISSKEWFATSLSSIGDAVITVDTDARITFMNPVAERMTGWKFEDAQGLSVLDVFNIINQETRKPAFNPVERVFKEGVAVGLANHTVLISKDGTEIVIEDSAAPIHDQNKLLGVIFVFRDMTEKYVQLQKTEHLNQDLKEALKSRDDFLSLASHELKTPLTSLKLMLQMSEMKMRQEKSDHLSPEALKKLFAVFNEQILRLNKLVNDLLDVSRIRAQKLSFQMEDVNFAELIQNQVERMGAEFKAAGSLVDVQLEGPILLKGDPMRLEQVLSNLFSNAIKYGGGHPIQISAFQEQAKAILRVKDHGIGIAKEKQEVIFNRFERAVATSNISGLGLGLYIVREIVSAHGGSISVESELGQGATFTVELPVKKVDEAVT